jgi:pimeloyl-ACP methyl ester carboxylesterase
MNDLDRDLVDEGAGTPVVFSHGHGLDVRYWEPQRAAFRASHRFVAYSRRFYGAGRWAPDADNSDNAHVADLLQVIDRLGPDPVHVVGFSASIALRAALTAPRVVRSLTIVEPNVPWLLEGDNEGEAVVEWWRAENDRVDSMATGNGERRARLWFELVNNRGPGTFRAQSPAFRAMWLDNFERQRPAAGERRPITCSHLAVLSVPTLVLGAEHGMPYSRLITERLARCVPGATLSVIPGVTHFMSYQDPGPFNEAVLSFVGEH